MKDINHLMEADSDTTLINITNLIFVTPEHLAPKIYDGQVLEPETQHCFTKTEGVQDLCTSSINLLPNS